MRTLRAIPFGKRITEVSFMGEGPCYGVEALRIGDYSTREEAVAAQTNAWLDFDMAKLAAQRFGKAQLEADGARAKLFEGTR